MTDLNWKMKKSENYKSRPLYLSPSCPEFKMRKRLEKYFRVFRRFFRSFSEVSEVSEN